MLPATAQQTASDTARLPPEVYSTSTGPIRASSDATPTVYTVGHSTRTLEELLGALKAHGVEAVGDVRRFPASRRLPHFNAEHLARELPNHGVAYIPCPLLGGRRRPDPDSINLGWRNESFRAYADYMQTPPFLEGLDLLVRAARQTALAMMCAEGVVSSLPDRRRADCPRVDGDRHHDRRQGHAA